MVELEREEVEKAAEVEMTIIKGEGVGFYSFIFHTLYVAGKVVPFFLNLSKNERNLP